MADKRGRCRGASTQRLTQQGVGGKSLRRLTGAYHNLLRMWVDA
ncbi:hypothetical protein [Burkholderia sp. Ac-20349]|nr:hypothetical protein [Burkholderia sp. Ac-20349]